MIEVDLNELAYDQADNWANYPKGMIRQFLAAGYSLPSGADLYFNGNLPNGAGLSSSASIELLTGVMINELFGFKASRLDLIKFGQKN